MQCTVSHELGKITKKVEPNRDYGSGLIRKVDFSESRISGIRSGNAASRTFAHRKFTHDWYFIDACQVNRPF